MEFGAAVEFGWAFAVAREIAAECGARRGNGVGRDSGVERAAVAMKMTVAVAVMLQGRYYIIYVLNILFTR